MEIHKNLMHKDVLCVTFHRVVNEDETTIKKKNRIKFPRFLQILNINANGSEKLFLSVIHLQLHFNQFYSKEMSI